MTEEEASEVCVHALVSTDEFIAECEAWHESSLLEPEDGGERTGEKDTLDGSKCNESLSERRVLVRDPAESPVGLPLHAWNRLDCVEKVFAFSRILDIGVNEERVRLRVDIFPKTLRISNRYQIIKQELTS